MAWRGELGEREAVERRERMGGGYRKSTPLPKSSWRDSGKVEKAAGTELKREKGERRAFKFHEDSINRGSTASATLQLNTWRCAGRKGESPGAEWGLGVFGPHAEAVPLLGGHLVEAVWRPPTPNRQRCQQTPENNHICWYWNKVIGGEAWCRTRAVIFQNP